MNEININEPCQWCGCPGGDHTIDCYVGIAIHEFRKDQQRRSQTVRQGSAKPSLAGSIPAAASHGDEHGVREVEVSGGGTSYEPADGEGYRDQE